MLGCGRAGPGRLGEGEQYIEGGERATSRSLGVTFTRHWELLEALVDDPDLAHIRFATFDGNQLTYRFRVIGIEAGGTIRLVEFAVVE